MAPPPPPPHLYLHSFIQRSVHQSVEGQEEGADGVEKGVAVFAVAVEPDRETRMSALGAAPDGGAAGVSAT